MKGGECTTDEELSDLHRGESLFDCFWDGNTEGGDGVVGVLWRGRESERTIKREGGNW